MKIVYILLCVAGLWLSYQAGQNEVELVCQKRFEDLRTLSEQEKKSSDQRISDLESQRVNERIQNNERIKEIERRHKSSVQNTPNSCMPNYDRLWMLSEAVRDPRLPKAEYPGRIENQEEPVTTDTLSEYTLMVISEYNNCAADFNKLSDMVNEP